MKNKPASTEDTAPVEPLRLGILGAGLAVKRLHWPALARLRDRFTIVQVCDLDEAAAREVAELVGGASTTRDYRELLGNPQVEAVLISLPIHLNAQMILAAARAGKHVLCEKPLAASFAQGQELARAVEGLPVVVAIAENYHFRPALRQAARWIQDGRIGTLFLVLSEGLSWTDTSQGFGGTPWRQDAQYRGGVLADAAVHNAAGLRELGGDVEQLQAFVKDVHPIMAGPDTLVLNLRFRNGALGGLVFSGAARGAGQEVDQFRALGTAGAIVVSTSEARLLRPAAEGDDTEVVETFSAPEGQGGGYYEEFLDFYEAIREGRAPRVPPAEALRDWAIIMRALDSAESRSVILL